MENEKNTRREEMIDSSDESWQAPGDKSFIRWLEPVNHIQSYLASPFYLSIFAISPVYLSIFATSPFLLPIYICHLSLLSINLCPFSLWYIYLCHLSLLSIYLFLPPLRLFFAKSNIIYPVSLYSVLLCKIKYSSPCILEQCIFMQNPILFTLYSRTVYFYAKSNTVHPVF